MIPNTEIKMVDLPAPKPAKITKERIELTNDPDQLRAIGDELRQTLSRIKTQHEQHKAEFEAQGKHPNPEQYKRVVAARNAIESLLGQLGYKLKNINRQRGEGEEKTRKKLVEKVVAFLVLKFGDEARSFLAMEVEP